MLAHVTPLYPLKDIGSHYTTKIHKSYGPCQVYKSCQVYTFMDLKSRHILQNMDFLMALILLTDPLIHF